MSRNLAESSQAINADIADPAAYPAASLAAYHAASLAASLAATHAASHAASLAASHAASLTAYHAASLADAQAAYPAASHARELHCRSANMRSMCGAFGKSCQAVLVIIQLRNVLRFCRLVIRVLTTTDC